MPLKECPECHADIGSMSAEEVLAHRNQHWEDPIPFPNINKLAIERAGQLDAEVDERRTTEKQAAARQTLKQGDR